MTRHATFTASSIRWHADFHATPQILPFAAEFAACRRKTWNCPSFYYIQGFSGFVLILPFIKQ